jgi:hypothetical protein
MSRVRRRLTAVALAAGVTVAIPATASATSATRLSARLSAATVTVRSTDEVTGTVTGGVRTVTLQQLSGRAWRPVRAVRTGAHGAFALPLSTAAAGTFAYRVSVAARHGYAALTGPVLRLTIDNATALSVRLSTASVTTGNHATLSGTVSGGARTVTQQTATTHGWVTVRHVTATGSYLFTVVAGAPGRFSYRILVAGKTGWSAVTSGTYTVTVTPLATMTAALAAATGPLGTPGLITGVVSGSVTRAVHLQQQTPDGASFVDAGTPPVQTTGAYSFTLPADFSGTSTWRIYAPPTATNPALYSGPLAYSVTPTDPGAGPYLIRHGQAFGPTGTGGVPVYSWMSGEPRTAIEPVYSRTGLVARGGPTLQISTATGAPDTLDTATASDQQFQPAAFTPDGRYLLYGTVTIDSTGQPTAAVAATRYDLTSHTATALPSSLVDVWAFGYPPAALSPDGQRAAYYDAQGVLQILDIAAGTSSPATIPDGLYPSQQVAQLTFAPNGTLIVEGQYVDPADNSFYLSSCAYPLDLNNPAPTLDGSQCLPGRQLALSPDGTRLLYVADVADDTGTVIAANVMLADGDGGNPRLLTQLAGVADDPRVQFVGNHAVEVGVDVAGQPTHSSLFSLTGETLWTGTLATANQPAVWTDTIA